MLHVWVMTRELVAWKKCFIWFCKILMHIIHAWVNGSEQSFSRKENETQSTFEKVMKG